MTGGPLPELGAYRWTPLATSEDADRRLPFRMATADLTAA